MKRSHFEKIMIQDIFGGSIILVDFDPMVSVRFGIRHFILIHSRTLCCSKATAGILLKNAWVEVAVGFANRFSTKNHCGLGGVLSTNSVDLIFVAVLRH